MDKLCIEDLISCILSGDGNTQVNRDKVISVLAKGITDHKDECQIYKQLYRSIYNDTLSPICCNNLINLLHQSTEHGSRWSLPDTNAVAAKLDIQFGKNRSYTPEEFRTAMHICYYDMNEPLKKSGIELDTTAWGRLADFYFIGDDEPKDKLVHYYFEKLCHSNLE